MTAEQWQQVKSLFDQALDHPKSERKSWLRSECPDAGMLDEVLSLLDAHTDDEEFLEHQTAEGRDWAAALRPESMVGQTLGHWRLVEEIGQGGMGTVYRAVRADDDFQRQVAIKIVSRGMDTDQLLRRFRVERQILANLEHPYIARLIDGGTTASGMPYFVMEYVKGVPLTEYCDRQRLGVTARIELFRKICSAVAYAHANLIVHRDLKPANILVTADGTPKLLDFGIARILSGSGRDVTEPTVTMLRMATPAYASPEQIRGGIAGIPSDIYSLGVILYELLTGHRPYRLPERESGELARVICEREPTRASVVVGFAEAVERADGDVQIDGESVSYDRDTTLDQLRRKLKGDLDNIMSMALRKEPHRRYESVDQFSGDLQRHSAGLPILARSDTFGYRAGKFIERNRMGVAAGVVVALLLAITSVVAIHKAMRLADRIEEDHRLASSFFVEIHDAIARLPGATPAREAILQQSLRYLNGLGRDAGDDPVFRRSLALAYEKFAELQAGFLGPGLGRTADALATAAKAQELREAVAKAFPKDLQVQYELANNYLLAGYIAGRGGRAEQRREYDNKALVVAERLTASDGRNPGYRAVLGRAHTSLAYGLMYSGQWEAGAPHIRRSLAIHTEVAAENPDDRKAQRDLAQIHYRVGSIYAQAGQGAEGRDHLLQALEIYRKLASDNTRDAQTRSDLAGCYHFLGIALGSIQKYDRALAYLDDAIAIRRAALELDPLDSRTRSMLAGNYAERSVVLLKSGTVSSAIGDARKAVQLQMQALENDPNGAATRSYMAEFEFRLASALEAQAAHTRRIGDWREAVNWYSKSLAHYDELQPQGNSLLGNLRNYSDQVRKGLARSESAVNSKTDF